MSRASGILLHPTSLPGPYGIGDLGPAAYRFVDFLVQADQTYWQVLPLGPTGYGDSPYQTFSAFAGNPFLVSPELLAEEGWLPPGALDTLPRFPGEQVDYGPVITAKNQLMVRVAAHFDEHGTPEQRDDVRRFAAEHQTWLPDFALFMALKDAHQGAPWTKWEAELASRQPEAIKEWSERLATSVRAHTLAQYLFFRQWLAVKTYANDKGIKIIGDAPIFVAHDSADCWANRAMFYLNPDGTPELVAGVPPDYFSETGQLWGNPLYRWDVLAASGYAWWTSRLRTTFSLVDLLRLDHFRGFAAYWAIPGNAPTAQIGTWEPGPGIRFFEAVRDQLGTLPIIAEDLGVITPDVEQMRDHFGFPGMRILQFGFGGDATNIHLPHNFSRAAVVYTGTHDNDTTIGWFASAPEAEQQYALDYIGSPSNGAEIAWDLIRLAQASVAETAIIPLQDALNLGTVARMNLPGTLGGNWSWRFTPDQLDAALAVRLARLTSIYGRQPTATTAL